MVLSAVPRVFPPFSFQDVIQTALQDVCLTPSRGKNGTRLACRAGVTPRNFLGGESRKSGVAPARFCFFPAVTFACSCFSIPGSSKSFQSLCGEERVNCELAERKFYSLHPTFLNIGRNSELGQPGKSQDRSCAFRRTSQISPRWQPSSCGGSSNFDTVLQTFPLGTRLHAWLR